MRAEDTSRDPNDCRDGDFNAPAVAEAIKMFADYGIPLSWVFNVIQTAGLQLVKLAWHESCQTPILGGLRHHYCRNPGTSGCHPPALDPRVQSVTDLSRFC